MHRSAWVRKRNRVDALGIGAGQNASFAVRAADILSRGMGERAGRSTRKYFPRTRLLPAVPVLLTGAGTVATTTYADLLPVPLPAGDSPPRIALPLELTRYSARPFSSVQSDELLPALVGSRMAGPRPSERDGRTASSPISNRRLKLVASTTTLIDADTDLDEHSERRDTASTLDSSRSARELERITGTGTECADPGWGSRARARGDPGFLVAGGPILWDPRTGFHNVAVGRIEVSVTWSRLVRSPLWQLPPIKSDKRLQWPTILHSRLIPWR
jgi:hypothetical protein